MRSEQPPRRFCRVVVVGAGASGLMAAHTLLPHLRPSTSQERRDPVIVLEARNRVGGRIHTVPMQVHKSDGSPLEVPIDMGAAFVHGTGAPFGSDGRGRDEELNPMVQLLRQANAAPPGGDGGVGGGSSKEEDDDPLGANLIYSFANGNPDTRPRDVLHGPLKPPKPSDGVGANDAIDTSSNDTEEASASAHPPQHLVSLYVAGRRVDPTSPAIPRALDLYERLLSCASRVGSAAYECGEGMATTTTISIGRAIDIIRAEAPVSYGLGYLFDKMGRDDVDGALVETLLGYYFTNLQMWHPHPLSRVQLSEFIVDDDDDGKDRRSESGGGEGDYPGPHCNVRGGMATMLVPLLRGLHDSLLCGEEAITIERCAGGNGINDKDGTIVVSCKSGLIVEAEYCIVTIPIGCLKEALGTNGNDGMFHPTLSADKQEAIASLQMGGYKKVFLTFEKVFWPRDQPYFGVIRKPLNGKMMLGRDDSDGIGNFLHVDNSWAKDDIACLEVTLSGSSAAWANGRCSEEIREEVTNVLDDAIGVEEGGQGASFASQCTGCHVTRWEEDEYCKGAYAGFVLGTLERHVEELVAAEWGGKLLFAGDATVAEYEGSVHGALLSGKRAAESILSDEPSDA